MVDILTPSGRRLYGTQLLDSTSGVARPRQHVFRCGIAAEGGLLHRGDLVDSPLTTGGPEDMSRAGTLAGDKNGDFWSHRRGHEFVRLHGTTEDAGGSHRADRVDQDPVCSAFASERVHKTEL